jgi:hypothetical protein
MPLFYFNIRDGNGLVEDEEGRELPDAAAARAEAVQGIRSILAEDVRQGRLDLHGRIDVLGERGEPLFSVSYAEALLVEPGEAEPPKPPNLI